MFTAVQKLPLLSRWLLKLLSILYCVAAQESAKFAKLIVYWLWQVGPFPPTQTDFQPSWPAFAKPQAFI